MIRGVLVFLHRWVGLLMTVFLVIVGLTGSLLAFYDDLEHVFAPQLFAKPRPGEAQLDMATLAERAATLVPPHARVISVDLGARAAHGRQPLDQATIRYRAETNPETGKPYELSQPYENGWGQFYVDPWTGAALARPMSSDLSEGLINLMPFIYRLHDALALGSTGATILGVVAVAWTIDCFVGFYLTLPVSPAGFWRKWKPAWLIKRKGGFYRLNFDLHRASGLWLWPILFIFAWSSVGFNMSSVYRMVMTPLFEHGSHAGVKMTEHMKLPVKERPALDWRAAQAVGAKLIEQQGATQGFIVGEAWGLSYLDKGGSYHYMVHSGDAFFSPHSAASVDFDADTGELLNVRSPAAAAPLGNEIRSWLFALHMAHVFGMPFRILVCALGLVITILSATGVYIWWKKRNARIAQMLRARTGATRPRPLEAA
ncbi:PepSY-associated TM helix domain-containing protein [Methylosinus sp. LW4]|uniref:PepSY-associated TM helix domain-containing protein n=1 Tax=Methylosinus sp. LW4 TaxID=136993 RepID=UPI000380DD59|nr:PepSY-associated TM helix domain-containing protein [Methylosinus sp. LW4]